MFSKLLIRLVDQAIVPAALLIAVRVISIFLFVRYFGLYASLNQTGFVISETPGATTTSPTLYVLINTYSTLAMIVVLSIALLYILAKSFIFHDSHITPYLTARMFSLNLSTFIQNSFEVYSQGIIWVSYLYLLIMVSGVMALFGLIQAWVFLVGLILAVVSTVLFILDVENELNIKKSSMVDPNDELEEMVVKFDRLL